MVVDQPKFLLYTRWGQQLGELPVLSAIHRQEINSTDELDLTLSQPLAKGDRVLWYDGRDWYEHVVDEQTQSHDGGETFEAVCISSLMADLELSHIKLWVAYGISAETALSTILENTTWTTGNVDDFGNKDVIFERESVYDAVCGVAGNWIAEFRPVITVGDWGVVSRKVDMVQHYGESTGVRFEYGYGMKGVLKETLSDGVYTAVYAYGKQLDTKTDGVNDRLTVTVERDDLLDSWGLPDGQGGTMHAWGVYENSECESSTQLEEEANAFLDQHAQPTMSYKTDIPFASLKGARLGDVVQVVDKEFTPELRLEARIGAIDRDILSGETTSCTFGTIRSVLPDALVRVYSQVNVMAAQTGSSNSRIEQVEQQVSTIDLMLSDGELKLGESTLSVVDGVLYLDGKELVVKESATT